MRQRITYFSESNDTIDPSTLHITGSSISAISVTGAREERLTFGFDELPEELLPVLRASHELHIRWATENSYQSITPLVSRLSPGLHIFVTLKAQRNSTSLCSILKKAFGEMDCISTEKSFTTLPAERFMHSITHQYYKPLSSLAAFTEYLFHKVCSSSTTSHCDGRLLALSDAVTLELSYTAKSQALVFSFFTPIRTQALSVHNPTTSRLEIGLLTPIPSKEPEELSLGGFLAVLGDDAHPKPTLFSFPSRHHLSSTAFTADFLSPSGLHPVLALQISETKPPVNKTGCMAHAHLTLPRDIFIDRYQFEDGFSLSNKNLTAINYISTPVDLEAPTYMVSLWGSSVLLQLSPPAPGVSHAQEWTAQIPMHLRYLMPQEGGIRELEVPYPVLFWACPAEDGSEFAINPFDKVNLGYDGLFDSRTTFYHMTPQPVQAGGRLVSALRVPVLDLQASRFVEAGTALTVLIGFGWVCWCLLEVALATGYGSTNIQSVAKKEKTL